MCNIAVLKSRKNLNKKKSWIKNYWLKQNKLTFDKNSNINISKNFTTIQLFNDIYVN